MTQKKDLIGLGVKPEVAEKLMKFPEAQKANSKIITVEIDSSAIVNGTNAGVLYGSDLVTVSKTATGTYEIEVNDEASETLRFLGGAVISSGSLVRLNNVTTDTSTLGVFITNTSGSLADADFIVTFLAVY